MPTLIGTEFSVEVGVWLVLGLWRRTRQEPLDDDGSGVLAVMDTLLKDLDLAETTLLGLATTSTRTRSVTSDFLHL
jgi:hypothetical protein